MASKSVICCVITIFLVNTNTVFSLDLSESLQRYKRAILSENVAEEVNKLINQDLSRTRVQSYVNSLLPESVENIRRLSVNEDLLENLVKNYAEDTRIKQAASSEDIQSILDVFNYEIGGTVLVLSNTSIVVDVDALSELLRAHTTTYIQELYPGNIYAQIVAGVVADEQIKLVSANLKSVIADRGISVELIGELTSLINNTNRTKRDLVTDLLLAILRPQIAAFLTPFQTEFNTIVNEVLTVVLSLYTATEPTGFFEIVISNVTNIAVIRVAEVIVVVQTDVNTLFNNIIYGNATSTARRKRDVDLEFENFYDFDSVGLEITHRRVTRDLVSDIFTLITNPISLIFSAVISPITNALNVIVKNIFVALLSSQYAAIGKLVTVPLRFIVNTLIDLVLPCTDCTSIV